MALQIKTHSTKHLIIGYIALAILFLALWYVDTRQIKEQQELINSTALATQKMRLLVDLIEIARKRTRLSHEMLALDDLFAKDDVYLNIENLAGLFSEKLFSFEKLPLKQDEKQILILQRDLYPQVIEKLEKVQVLVLEETEQGDILARNLIIHEIVPLQEKVVDSFMRIMSSIQNDVSQETRQSTEKHQKLITYRYTLIGIIFFASLAVLFKVMSLMLKIEKSLQSDSLTDGLTGIANRRCFDHMLSHEWKKALRSKEPLSLLLIDIDYFKKYNDLYGHQEGDQCLINVSQVIQSATHRQSDIAARYGGEEFAVILPGTDTAGALTVANGLLEKIRTKKIPHRDSTIEDFLTLSIGIATAIPMPQDEFESLLKSADDALYESKEHGRNRVTVHVSKSIQSLT